VSARYHFEDESPRSSAPVVVAIASATVLVLALVILAVALARHNSEGEQHAAASRHATPVREAERLRAVQRPEASAGRAVGEGIYTVIGLAGLAVLVVLFLLWVLMLVFVVQDCRNRGVDNGALWMLIVAGGHSIGFIIYMLSRPQGPLVNCEQCGNRRLPYVALCPHCRRPVQPY
jgi:hypothetical protein